MKYRLTIIVSIAIFILSTIPIPEVPELSDVPFFDKWVHFLMYGTLTFAMHLDHKIAHKSINKSLILTAFLFPTIFGGIMELIQAYCTTCRTGDWIDFYADAFGALLATIISFAIWKIVKISVPK